MTLTTGWLLLWAFTATGMYAGARHWVINHEREQWTRKSRLWCIMISASIALWLLCALIAFCVSFDWDKEVKW